MRGIDDIRDRMRERRQIKRLLSEENRHFT